MYVGRDFPDLMPGKIETFDFDLAKRLGDGETLSTPVWTVAVLEGVDPDPASRVVGAAAVAGTKIVQKIGNCLAGVHYAVTGQASSSLGQVIGVWSRFWCKGPS